MPLVSICLPNLNNRPFLEERLQTIHDQTLTDWELVIVDNFSDDGAWELFQEHAAREPRIRLSQAPKAGMYANWNNTIRAAEGEFVYVATSDDTLYPDCLNRAVEALRAAGTGVLFFGIDTIDAESRVVESWHQSRRRPPVHVYGPRLREPMVVPGREEFIAQAFGAGLYQSITGVLFRREVFDDVGPFPTGFGVAGDTAWIMRVALRNDFAWIPDRLATWRLHDSQSSRAKAPGPGAAGPSDRERAVEDSLIHGVEAGLLAEADADGIRRGLGLSKAVWTLGRARAVRHGHGLGGLFRRAGLSGMAALLADAGHRLAGGNRLYARRAAIIHRLWRNGGR